MRFQTTGIALLLVAAGSAAAQEAARDDIPAALRGGFAEVGDWVTRAAALVPADQYGYRPVETVRTFGQLVGHLADSYNYYCARGAGREVEWADPVEKGSQDKAVLVAKLKEATEACTAAYAGANGRPQPLLANVGHTSLHYGNMVTYLRMLGLVPPSS
ncbi:MAG TPA: DinB family protein [Gemmatimonadales bacterium]|nr:DinB family protein [Gemmatimonadales bacterium]